MRSPRRFMLPSIFIGSAMIAGLLGWASGSGRIGDDRADLDRRIATYINVLTTVREERTRRPELDARIAAIVDRTLGTDLEHVDAELRRRIAGLCESAGLQNVTVTTLGASVLETPARRTFRKTSAEKAFRDEADFAMVGATASGTGSLEEVVRLLHGLDAASWMKRIESVRLDPDRDGSRIKVAVRVSTIFVPGGQPDPEGVPANESRRDLGRYAALIERNPFVLPKPEPEPQPVPVVAPEPPKAPVVDPLGKWVLTGLVEGGPGDEAWCRHRESGRTVTLLPGTKVDLPGGGTVFLVEIKGDVATIRSGEETWRVLVGSTLDRRLR